MTSIAPSVSEAWQALEADSPTKRHTKRIVVTSIAPSVSEAWQALGVGPQRKVNKVLLSVVALVCLALSVRVRTDDPVSSNVRYTGEIVRILERRCLHCHGNDGLAMPLTNYRDVRAWGRAIREEIVEQRMPPWSAARGYRRFKNDLALTAREETTILSWLDGGMARGDDRDLPRPPASTPRAADMPNLRLPIPPQHVPALEDHVVRRVSIDANLDADRMIQRLVIDSGTPGVLRGALVFAGDPDNGGRWVGAWLPWQSHVAPPDGNTFRLPARARITVELHYRGGEKEVVDRPFIDVYYAEGREIHELAVQSGAPLRVANTTTVWAIVPTAGSSTSSLELTARRPNGSTDVLLWIPEFRRDWPQALVLEEPVTLPAGSKVSLVAHPPGAAALARLSVVR